MVFYLWRSTPLGCSGMWGLLSWGRPPGPCPWDVQLHWWCTRLDPIAILTIKQQPAFQPTILPTPTSDAVAEAMGIKREEAINLAQGSVIDQKGFIQFLKENTVIDLHLDYNKFEDHKEDEEELRGMETQSRQYALQSATSASFNSRGNTPSVGCYLPTSNGSWLNKKASGSSGGTRSYLEKVTPIQLNPDGVYITLRICSYCVHYNQVLRVKNTSKIFHAEILDSGVIYPMVAEYMLG
ncbi:uncharacterized protein PGTG_12792 [Puccinia graminis f. sp. tritici CRL 75-36-700-3]|uniref:Uncharacterized protein n=1 Tax=Puccinia graminis f. sp. tritici (strain CRL 75-36-700-3 / race SCCL) TaxID=418459 RepID=E3KSC2_PUCGT|nr:uncharacterized protein PGTG_12792 [Puccinia graminis f. sp. tritici CRL 75-36-700-3]EFP87208.1 hypothetical protein PGTG_12792 [Puccinia graminis f. sp. tritici CRL 75-36-700-3]